MKKKHILFVDDDASLLDGLKRLLRKKRKVWHILFANNGQEAIEIIRSKDISIIVADMRMPGMNGADVLKTVNSISPKTIRFILSGQACKEMVLQAVNYAHIYLAKPCKQEDLLSTLEKASSLHDLMLQSEVHEITTRIGSLPSIPSLYQQLVEEINSEEPCIDNVAKIITSDPGMCSKILHIVNSAFFSLPRNISTALEATSILGLDTISSLVLTNEVFQQISPDTLKRFNVERMWSHANGTAAIAKAIAKSEGLIKDKINRIVTASMLHEIGKLLVLNAEPDVYQQILDCVANEGLDLEQAERKFLKATSTDIGAYLLGLWGLPNEVIRGIAYYRHPQLDEENTSTLSTACIVHVSQAFERSISGRSDNELESATDTANLNKMGISNEKLDNWMTIARGALGAKA